MKQSIIFNYVTALFYALLTNICRLSIVYAIFIRCVYKLIFSWRNNSYTLCPLQPFTCTILLWKFIIIGIVSNVKNQLNELICCALDNDLTLPDIVGKLSDTMSDRSANEKKQTSYLGEWRTEVVADQQTQVVNNIYCMEHELLALHNYAKKQLSMQQKEMKKDWVVMGRNAMPVYARTLWTKIARSGRPTTIFSRALYLQFAVSTASLS